MGNQKNMMKEVRRRKFFTGAGKAQVLKWPFAEMMINKSICPLCGKPNDCYMENSRDPKDCWCKDVIIPKGMFELVPEEALHQACICRACILKYTESMETVEDGASKSNGS